MEPTSKRSMVSAATVLSPDMLWQILLRVPAKTLWRCRAACWSCRPFFSDSSFIQAHPVLRPCLIVALAGKNDRIDMTDLSGNVVRQISIAPQDVGVPPHGPFYLLLHRNRVRVLDLDNGAASALPLDDLQRRVGSSYEGSYTLGWVASTGQHKVLCVVSQYSLHCPAGRFNERVEQHCHVFTLGDDDRRCWRPVASAPLCVDFLIIRRHVVAHSAAIDGVVYFIFFEIKRTHSPPVSLTKQASYRIIHVFRCLKPCLSTGSLITNQRVSKPDSGNTTGTNSRNRYQMHTFLTKTIHWLPFDIAAPNPSHDQRPP
jgi:hypothetical protein